VYLQYKFQAKQTKDAKVMSKKTFIGGQGDKKKDKCFLQSPSQGTPWPLSYPAFACVAYQICSPCTKLWH